MSAKPAVCLKPLEDQKVVANLPCVAERAAFRQDGDNLMRVVPDILIPTQVTGIIDVTQDSGSIIRP